MRRRDFLKTLGQGAGALGLSGCLGPPGRSLPNFIVICTDDQGYADLGCYGATDINTPRLDRMAREGMKLTSFYSQPVCGPARAALLTGCYPPRVMRENWSLDSDEITIAEILRQAGYATACVGKWDLSERRRIASRMPTAQGFDEFFGTLGANDEGSVGLWRNHRELGETRDMGSLTSRFTDEAISFIRRNTGGPFFLLLAHTMPHVKLGASKTFVGQSKRGLYGDVVEEIDFNCGRILDTVQQLGLAQDTIILFTSDNGPWLEEGKMGGDAGPLRDGKGSSWEGGFRVPGIVWGPGRVPAGRTSGELISTLDILPTFAAMAGKGVPTDRVIDGRDQSYLLTGKTQHSAQDTFYYYVRSQLQAVRKGRWKLALVNRSETYSFAMDKQKVPAPQLYDLESDVGEKHDLASSHLNKVFELLWLADAARNDIGDLGKIGLNAR